MYVCMYVLFTFLIFEIHEHYQSGSPYEIIFLLFLLPLNKELKGWLHVLHLLLYFYNQKNKIIFILEKMINQNN